MSIKAMSYAWETSYAGSKKLLLLALADRANDDGECYPGITDFTKKVGVTRRRIQQMLEELERDGEIITLVGGGIKTTHGATNKYYMAGYRRQIGMATPALHSRKAQAGTSPQTGWNTRRGRSVPARWTTFTLRWPKANILRGVAHFAGGVKPTTPQGVKPTTPQGVKPTTPKPSVEPSVELFKESALLEKPKDRVQGRMIFTFGLKGNERFEDNAPIDPATFNLLVTDLYYAWWDTNAAAGRLPIGNARDLFRENLNNCKSLVLARITPEEVEEFMTEELATDFWKGIDSGVSTKHVAGRINAWRTRRAAQKTGGAWREAVIVEQSIEITDEARARMLADMKARKKQ